ncbi:hypothetical protein Cni_G00937 [Canna indica]|uniref:BSD domain-containing protein n=1 Tax=Canna indica TaxID=4628 RepID=A0AAQ3JNN6_9LILI|nr:hypothetical protein Cni_G00937 [Canna indica]
MSWLARSLSSRLMPDRQDGETDARNKVAESASPHPYAGGGEDGDPRRGVKEDLSELSGVLARQFRGVASFLAPPPSASSSSARDADDLGEVSDSSSVSGFRTDLAEIGGRFRSGISKLSGSKAVSEISKIATTFLPFGPDEEEEEREGHREWKDGIDAVGVTEEVMAFVRNISMHPETWLDFPLLPDDEESDDFDMSDAQQEHALAVEYLAPRLAALRIELCPSHMSEGCFWKIYFVLLHPRLNKHDAELLSTPQIVEARALLLQKLQNRSKTTEKPRVDVSDRKVNDLAVQSEEQIAEINVETSPSEAKEALISVPITETVTEKHPVQTTEIEVIDKSVIEEESSTQLQKDHSDVSKISIERFDEDEDDWLEDETGEMGASGSTSIPLGSDEDVSFSDLEEEDDRTAPKVSKK